MNKSNCSWSSTCELQQWVIKTATILLATDISDAVVYLWQQVPKGLTTCRSGWNNITSPWGFDLLELNNSFGEGALNDWRARVCGLSEWVRERERMNEWAQISSKSEWMSECRWLIAQTSLRAWMKVLKKAKHSREGVECQSDWLGKMTAVRETDR